jgi:hypothetical protein
LSHIDRTFHHVHAVFSGSSRSSKADTEAEYKIVLAVGQAQRLSVDDHNIFTVDAIRPYKLYLIANKYEMHERIPAFSWLTVL